MSRNKKGRPERPPTAFNNLQEQGHCSTAPPRLSTTFVNAGLRLPCDTIELLRHGGDPLIIEAAMRHLIREYEPFEEDAGEGATT
jgi:hypothetical protein